MRKNRKIPANALRLCAALMASAFALVHAAPYKLVETRDVAPVASGFRVGFSLLTAVGIQYVAYYDPQHRMTVAARAVDSDEWRFQLLPSTVGWDSHNSITMAVDRDGHLHLAGNMHASELVYFRSGQPGKIDTLKRLPMTGREENRVTYPNFLTTRDGQLVFNYRDGGSGNGNHIYNLYDPATQTWKRMLDTPLLDGERMRNAYPAGPSPGPDGWYHMTWVWRDTPDCATNHHLSYARSRDLIHWESASGHKVKLPMKLDQEQLWVDPIPSHGGIINGGFRLSFDSKNQPLIAYHKADRKGHMQIHAARPDGDGWTSRQLTDWDKRIEFSGNGSMSFIGIEIGGLSVVEPGVLTMTYRHKDYGSGRLFIDEKTLRPVEKRYSVPKGLPRELERRQSDFKGMEIRRAMDLGGGDDDKVRYMLQWESLGANRDKRPPELPPEPSMLRLHKLIADTPDEAR